MESRDWNYEKLQKIKINVEKIDRLYEILCIRDNYKLIARMRYENKFLYVKLFAYYNRTKYVGTITISEYPSLFIKAITISNLVKNFILGEGKKQRRTT